MEKQVIVIGCGGHGKVVADAIRKSGSIFKGFLDDNKKESFVLGTIDECVKYSDCSFVIGIGDNEIRRKITEQYNWLDYCTVIHPSAIIGDSVTIGAGTVVLAGAILNSCATVGSGCIINSSAIIEHDCRIEDFVHISPGAILCGTVSVGKCTHIGAGAVVKNNLFIGADITVGVGAAVVKNLDYQGVYAGIPARRLSD